MRLAPRPERMDDGPSAPRRNRWQSSRRDRTKFRPLLAPLEDRVVLTSIVEIEPNNTFGTAHGVVVNTGSALTTTPENWLNISGSIGAADVDYYQFVLAQRFGRLDLGFHGEQQFAHLACAIRCLSSSSSDL